MSNISMRLIISILQFIPNLGIDWNRCSFPFLGGTIKSYLINSRAVLLNFIDTDLFERTGKAISNFSETLPAHQSDLAQEITKDPYNFNPLTLDQKYDEKDLKDALINNVSKLLIEMGSGFAYMGREYSLPSIEDIENELKEK